jgi:hypothetical protein
VNTSSQLALRYNDASVLEHHHAATAFALMDSTKLLANMDREEYRALRKLIVGAILATDSACSFMHVAPRACVCSCMP